MSVLAIWRRWRRPRDPRGAVARPAPSPDAATPVANHVQAQPEVATAWAWWVAEAALLPAGADVASAWRSLQLRATRPELDPVLTDHQGLPVFTGRVPAQHLGPDDALGVPAPPGPLEADADLIALPTVRRACALLGPPWQAVLARVAGVAQGRANAAPSGPADGGAAGWAPAHGVWPAHDAHAAGAWRAHLSGMAPPDRQPEPSDSQRPTVTVRLILPLGWTVPEREALVAAVRRQSGALLDAAQWLGAAGVHWLTEPVNHPEAWWDELDQTLLRWAGSQRPEWLLVLAVDTLLSEEQVQAWQDGGELFTATHQHGRMPGEGAVACWLTSPACRPEVLANGQAPLRLWPPVRLRRQTSADRLGRVAADELALAIGQALRHAGGAGVAASCLTVVSDGDHRASRTGELFEALLTAAPATDPLTQVTRLGEACGDLGCARVLAAAVMASQALRQGVEPEAGPAPASAPGVALAVQLQHPLERVAVCLTPSRPWPLAT